MFKTRFISMLVLLAAVVVGAWAQTDYSSYLVEASRYNGDFDDAGFWDWANEGLNGKVISQDDALVWAQYQKQQTGNATAILYADAGNRNDLYYITDTGATGTVWWGDDVSDSAIKDCKIYALSKSTPDGLVPSTTVAVTGVTLSPTTATLTAGGAALELTPTVAPEGATDKTVKWSVVQEGSIVALYTDQACTQAVGTDAIAAAKVYVKPLAAGQATVTVTTNDGAKTATCTVTVAEPTYNVTFKAGTEDVGNWTATPSSAKKGETVTVKYTGTKKVKSVKAVKKQ